MMEVQSTRHCLSYSSYWLDTFGTYWFLSAVQSKATLKVNLENLYGPLLRSGASRLMRGTCLALQVSLRGCDSGSRWCLSAHGSLGSNQQPEGLGTDVLPSGTADLSPP